MRNKILLSVFILILFLFSNTHSFGMDSEYYKNLTDSSVTDIFNVNLKEIVTNPFEWIIDRETYILVEKTSDDEIIYWFNTPNMQTVIFNSIENLLPSGYIGHGIIPYDIAEYKNYSNLMGEYNNPLTAQQRYGFDIPNPSYIGEYPKITLNLMGVMVEKNPFKFMTHKIRSIVLGTSAIKPPDNKVLSSLEYISPNDYTNNDNSFHKWIDLYWDKVMSNMEDEQILLDEELIEDEELGTDENGVCWIKANILESGNIPESVGKTKGKNTSRDIDMLLQEYCGPNYTMVVKNIILWGIENGYASNFYSRPERIMPYQRDTLRSEDRQALVEDPRVYGYNTNINLLHLPAINLNFSISSAIKNEFASRIINSAGVISRWTIILNSITNFSIIDTESGKEPIINILQIWNSPISTVFIIVVSIMLIFTLLRQIILLLKGEKGLFRILTRALTSFLIIGFIIFITVSPNSFLSLIKTAGNFLFNMGTQTMMSTPVANKFVKPEATAEDRINCSYWLPYFSLWTKYNTGANLTDSSNIVNIENLDNEPEQQSKTQPGQPNKQSYDISQSQYSHTWSCILADSFTEGFIIKNKAYRVVDHFLAPRIKYNGHDSRPIITSTENENYNGGIQKSLDLGIYSLILLTFLGVFIKFVLFVELIYEIVMIQVNLAVASINKGRIKHVLKRFACSIVRIGLWDFVICMILYTTLYTSGIFAFLLSIGILLLIVKIIVKLSESNSVWSPRIISATTNFFERHKGV